LPSHTLTKRTVLLFLARCWQKLQLNGISTDRKFSNSSFTGSWFLTLSQSPTSLDSALDLEHDLDSTGVLLPLTQLGALQRENITFQSKMHVFACKVWKFWRFAWKIVFGQKWKWLPLRYDFFSNRPPVQSQIECPVTVQSSSSVPSFKCKNRNKGQLEQHLKRSQWGNNTD
jgi:hypothetical protein